MRKRLIRTNEPGSSVPEQGWLDLEQLATVEVTSEDPSHPVEQALTLAAGAGSEGWRAAEPGEQILRLIFDNPQSLKRIQLVFVEKEAARTQEFVLRWSPDSGRSYREILRQQWNFSPSGSQTEVEDLAVEIFGATILELIIVPDKSGGQAIAQLAKMRVA